MNESEKPSFFAIIPATVRYDKELTANAKLLYGEISALTNKEGYCWASNEYFAKLYGVSKASISAWISQLAKNKYISLQMIYKEGSKEILNRYIKLFEYPIQENLNTPIQENLKDNITSLNNTFNNTYNDKLKKEKKAFIPPTLEEVINYVIKKQLVINPYNFFSYYSKLDWKDNQGKQVKSWKGKAVTWDSREREKNPSVLPYSSFSSTQISNGAGRTALTHCPDCGSELDRYMTCPVCKIEYDLTGRAIK